MTVALYALRCKQMGLTLEELDFLNIGMVWGMIIESNNDEYKYPKKATKKQFHEFLRG